MISGGIFSANTFGALGGGGTGGGGASPLTTKGDLYTYSTLDARLPVGTNGQVLSANSAEATGLKWIAAAGGLTIGAAITGGTANRILFEGAGNVLAENANFTFDGTTLTIANHINFGAGSFSELRQAGAIVAYVKSGGAGYFQANQPIYAATILNFGAEAGTFAYPFFTSYFGEGGMTIGVPYNAVRANYVPNYALDIRATGNPTIQLSKASTGHLSTDGYLFSFDGTNLTLNNQESGYTKFDFAGTEKLRISRPLANEIDIATPDGTELHIIGDDVYFRDVDAGIFAMRINSGGIITQIQLAATNGSAATPAYSFDSDVNTGMYRDGVDSLGFSTNGSLKLLVGSTGAVTLGPGAGGVTHRFNSNTGTVGADVLTLTNGPTGTAGNPDTYLTLNINGTDHVIPAWIP